MTKTYSLQSSFSGGARNCHLGAITQGISPVWSRAKLW